MDSNRIALAVTLFATIFVTSHAPDSQAADWLNEVIYHPSEDGVSEIEVVLGNELTLVSAFAETSSWEFRAKAVAGDGAVPGGWEYVELSFDEDDNALHQVAVEGSIQKGFDVILKFHDPVHLQTLPQYSANRFSVLQTSPKIFRSLSNFSTSANAEFGPVALRFTLAGRFAVNAIPAAIASNRKVYRHPDVPDEVRIGFYPTKTAANVALRELRGRYPDIDLVYVSAGEVEYAKRFNLYTDRVVGIYGLSDTPESLVVGAPAPSLSIRSITPDTIDVEPEPEPAILEWQEDLDRSVLDQAREAYLDGDYDTAIALYTKAGNEPRLREEATEMLGVARERNGQLAHAKSIYERYLQAYPDSVAAARVQQRLQSLVGNEAGLPELRHAQDRSSDKWSLVGNLSQFYRRQSVEVNHQDTSIPIDALFSDVNAIARRNGHGAIHEARISVGHIQDFSDRDSRPFRVHRIYWESFFKKFDVGFTAGRQSLNGVGILGRFDGLATSYRQRDNLEWTIAGGYLADSTFDGLSRDRPFYGINAQLQLLDGRIEISPFYVEQKRDGVLDRRALGVQIHYYSERIASGALLDYDIYHQALNNLYLTGSYNLNKAWRINGAFDFRRSPYLTTSNALIGQGYEDLSELEQSLIDLKLEDIAEDRTATSNVIRVGIDGKLNGTWSVSMDASMSDFSATETSLGINGLESHNDFYLSTQLRANNLFVDDSYSAMQLRYMTSDNSETAMVYLTNRFRWNSWLVHPRMIASQRTFKNSDQQQTQLRPSLRVDYRGFDRFRLEFEVGYEWTTRETAFQDIDILGLYFNIGYRTLF